MPAKSGMCPFKTITEVSQGNIFNEFIYYLVTWLQKTTKKTYHPTEVES